MKIEFNMCLEINKEKSLKRKCSKANNNNSQRTCETQIIRLGQKVEELDTLVKENVGCKKLLAQNIQEF